MSREENDRDDRPRARGKRRRKRLRPYTDTLPKALVPVGAEGDPEAATVLDLTLGNFAEIGLTEVGVVVGYRKEAVYARKEALEARYGLRLTLIDNDKAEESGTTPTRCGVRGTP